MTYGGRVWFDQKPDQMNKYALQIALDGRKLGPTDAFDLLGHVLDIELIANLARIAAEPAGPADQVCCITPAGSAPPLRR